MKFGCRENQLKKLALSTQSVMNEKYRLPSRLSNEFGGAKLRYCRGCCKFKVDSELHECFGYCGAFWHMECLFKERNKIEKRPPTANFFRRNFKCIIRKQSLCPTCICGKECNKCGTQAKAYLIRCYTCSRVFHEECVIALPNAALWQCEVCRPCSMPTDGILTRNKLKLANVTVTTRSNSFRIPENFFENLRLQSEIQNLADGKFKYSIHHRTRLNSSMQSFHPIGPFHRGRTVQMVENCRCRLPHRIPKIYICEFCLTIQKSRETIECHYHNCQSPLPPGDEIYRDHSLSVFEIDGDIFPSYCIELCLLAKCWLKEKGLYVEVGAFLFYVLVFKDKKGYHMLGFFSKEKRWKQNNLACVLVLPPYQKQGYGRFLIELSYLLSRKEGKAGKPESPLSEHGHGVYTAYWKSAILEYFSNHQSTDAVTIEDISHETGIIDVDIVNTLIALNFMRLPETHESPPALVIDWSLVESHRKKKFSLKVCPDNLLWRPHQFSNKTDESPVSTEHVTDEIILMVAPDKSDTSVFCAEFKSTCGTNGQDTLQREKRGMNNRRKRKAEE